MATSKVEMVSDGVADDEMPELTAKKLRTARSFSELLTARGMRRLGRPPSSNPKVRITIRLDADVVEHFKNKGAGWQTRLNEALADVIESEKRPQQTPRARPSSVYAKRAAAKAAKSAAKTATAKKPAPKGAVKAASQAPAKRPTARKAAPKGLLPSRRAKLTA